MNSITYSAPAKTIISGEHAVVYGKPSLVSALNLRLTFNIREDKKLNSDIHIAYISELVKKFLKENNYEFQTKAFQFSIDSQIPIGRGLGSSAALSVAATAALLEFYSDKVFDKETINKLAYAAEKHFHRNPSGADNSASCFGGLIFYRKEFEFLKNISSLNFKIPKNIAEHLYLIDSGKPVETTAEMVQGVGKKYNSQTKKTEEILNKIEKTTKRLVVSVIKEDGVFFAESVVENQNLLEKLHVVSHKTKLLIASLQQFGVGKITGAGGKKQGSGFVLFYAKDNKKLEKHLEDKRISYYQYEQSLEGLKKI